MARYAEDLGSGVIRASYGSKPLRAAPQNRGSYRNGFDIVNRGRAAIETDIRGKRRLQPRHALFAFEAFEQRCFLAADIGTRTVVQDDIAIPPMDIVPADQLRGIGLIDGSLETLALAHEFAANVNVAGTRTHRETGDQATLDEMLRIVPHDVPVLAGAGLRIHRR